MSNAAQAAIEPSLQRGVRVTPEFSLQRASRSRLRDVPARAAGSVIRERVADVGTCAASARMNDVRSTTNA
jgi:hypothetical protein